MTHELKILPQYYQAVIDGRKTFELREDDRGYKEGDNIHFREWTGQYTGREAIRHIPYILRDCPEYGLKQGYCILALEAVKQ